MTTKKSTGKKKLAATSESKQEPHGHDSEEPAMDEKEDLDLKTGKDLSGPELREELQIELQRLQQE